MEPLPPVVFHILLSLFDEAWHGYGIMQDVSRRDRPGGDERRRYYRLTSKGRISAVSEAERLERLLSSAYGKALIPHPRSA